MKNVILFVEGRSDAQIIEHIFTAALIPLDKINIQIAGGKEKMMNQVHSLKERNNMDIAVLMDSDELFVADARKKQQEEWKEANVHLFFAVPTIEAWIFADDVLALAYIQTTDEKELKRLPFPEEIPFPKDLAIRLFGNRYNLLGVDFLKEMNIEVAVSRTPSLRDFLLGITQLLGIKNEKIENATNQSFDLKIIENLLKEVLESQTVIYKTVDGRNITVAEMQKSIRDGSETGKIYAADLLRISRDFLKRKANPRVPI